MDPLSAGLYSFSTERITLAPSTRYAVVLTATTASEMGGYQWNSTTANYSGDAEWTIDSVHRESLNGIDWVTDERTRMQFAVSATAIPEPSTILLLGLGGLLAASRFRRWAKVSQQE